MNILVTGGCGFIGSNFIHYIIGNYSYKVVNLDALTYAGNLDNLKDIEDNKKYKFIHGIIEDSLLVNKIIEDGKISVIINFSAESHVDRSIMDSSPFIKTNIEGTRVILDTVRAHPDVKFIHISTDEVYGTLPSAGLFTEETPLAPNSPYSASKASADLLVRAYRETYKLSAIIIRCSNNYGPYQFPEKYIPLTITNLLQGEMIPLYGDGLNIRDWIYVDDFCRAIDFIMHKGKDGEIYNVGGRGERTNLEIAHTILKSLGKPKSFIKFVKDRPGHDRRYAMDITKINRELGWLPQVSLEEGIRKTIQWYQENIEWWMKIKSGEYRKYYEEMYGERLARE